MKKRYDEVMDRIEVTEQMRSRILENIRKADLEPAPSRKIIPFSSARKYLSLAACLAVLLFGAVTLFHLQKNTGPQGPDVVIQGSGIAEVSSGEALSQAVGFAVRDVTQLPFAAEQRTYVSYWNELAEIQYTGEEQQAVFRMSPGNEDNSGDYTQYPAVEQISVGTLQVTLKGQPDSFTLAVWSDGEYAYSLSLSAGLSRVEWETLIGSVK